MMACKEQVLPPLILKAKDNRKVHFTFKQIHVNGLISVFWHVLHNKSSLKKQIREQVSVILTGNEPMMDQGFS